MKKPKYTSPVKFSATNRYGCGPESEDDVYTIDEWLVHVASGSFIDYDGHGKLVKDGKAVDDFGPGSYIKPSMVKAGTFKPFDATHIVWFNR